MGRQQEPRQANLVTRRDERCKGTDGPVILQLARNFNRHLPKAISRGTGGEVQPHRICYLLGRQRPHGVYMGCREEQRYGFLKQQIKMKNKGLISRPRVG